MKGALAKNKALYNMVCDVQVDITFQSPCENGPHAKPSFSVMAIPATNDLT